MNESSTPGSAQRFAPPVAAPPGSPIKYGEPAGEAVSAEVASRILQAARREKPTWFKRWLADAMVPDQPNGSRSGQ